MSEPGRRFSLQCFNLKPGCHNLVAELWLQGKLQRGFLQLKMVQSKQNFDLAFA